MINQDMVKSVSNSLNKYLEEKSVINKNLRLIDVDQITGHNGVKQSLDYRSYLAFKDLYTSTWLQAYVNHAQHLIYSISGKIKKALILDCDNTLWKGILGEDGFDNIEMSSSTKGGEPFTMHKI